MSCKERLIAFLQDKRPPVPFQLYEHPDADTTMDMAEYLNADPGNVVKVVMVWVDKELMMLLVPASKRVNFARLETTWPANGIRLAREADFADRFPDCELGAMPPFGNLYNLKVYIDGELTNKETIIFHIGTHTNAMALHYVDFKRVVDPVQMDLTSLV